MGLDAAGGECGEEFIVAVYVVVEAMDENYEGFWGSIGLGELAEDAEGEGGDALSRFWCRAIHRRFCGFLRLL
jgi:hypothetical protein